MPEEANQEQSSDRRTNIERTKRKRQIKVARRLIREVLLEKQAAVTDEEVEGFLRDIATSLGQEDVDLTRWDLLQLIRDKERTRNTVEEVDYEHEFDSAFFAVADQDAWQDEDVENTSDHVGVPARLPAPRAPTPTPRRHRRPRFRNPRHSSPYHLVPEPSPLDPNSMLSTDASADPTSPFLTEPSRFCRICLSDEMASTFIAPCKCDGSAKWVHAHCLLRWRKTSAQPMAKVQCEVCHTYYRFQGHPLSFGWTALHQYVTIQNAQRVCWGLIILYYLLLQYVIKVLCSIVPGGFIDGTTGLQSQIWIQGSWIFFPWTTLYSLLRWFHYHSRHIPLTLFFLGAFKNLPDEVMTGYGVVHFLFALLAYVFPPFQILSDVLWLMVMWYGIPTLYMATRGKVYQFAQGAVRVWMELGSSVTDEVVDYRS